MVVEPFEVTLPIKPVKNPVPFLADGGDCGPCAICAAVGWGAERIPGIYRLAGVDPPRGLALPELRKVLHVLQWDHRLLEVADAPVLPRTDAYYPTLWGYPGWTLADEWFDQLNLRLRSQWVGLTTIDFWGRGPVELDNGWPRTRIEDGHVVLLTGARARWVEVGNGGRRLVCEVRVTDSSTRRPDEWWCEVEEFLLRYGGFRMIWLRTRFGCARPHSS